MTKRNPTLQERRRPDGERMRLLLDSLLERLDELARTSGEHSGSQRELAVLLARVEVTIDMTKPRVRAVEDRLHELDRKLDAIDSSLDGLR